MLHTPKEMRECNQNERLVSKRAAPSRVDAILGRVAKSAATWPPTFPYITHLFV